MLGNPKSSRAISSGYFDFYKDDKIIFSGADGMIGYFDIEDFKKNHLK